MTTRNICKQMLLMVDSLNTFEIVYYNFRLLSNSIKIFQTTLESIKILPKLTKIKILGRQEYSMEICRNALEYKRERHIYKLQEGTITNFFTILLPFFDNYNVFDIEINYINNFLPDFHRESGLLKYSINDPMDEVVTKYEHYV